MSNLRDLFERALREFGSTDDGEEKKEKDKWEQKGSKSKPVLVQTSTPTVGYCRDKLNKHGR